MQPRDRLTAKEIQVATLVWQGLTNKDIARVLITSEQVVKNYLRTAFDKLGVWTRLELALYVAGHGGANWHVQLGNGLLPPSAAWGVAAGDQVATFTDTKSSTPQRLAVFPRNSASTSVCRRRRPSLSGSTLWLRHVAVCSGVPSSRFAAIGADTRACRFRAAILSPPSPA
jgi:DNA-binding CsgD family transcriptional regulator